MTTNYDQPLGTIDQETRRYLHLTKKYPHRHFLCDSCGQEYQSAPFYSLAAHESQLPYARVYCESCLKATPAGQKRLKKEKGGVYSELLPTKNMKNTKLKKTKQVKNTNRTKSALTLPTTLSIKPKTKSPTTTKTKLYYRCMNACCKGKNITRVARECRTNAPALLAINAKQRNQEINQIKSS